MSFEGPKNLKLQGGLGRRNPSTDNIGGLVMGGVAVVGKIALGEVHRIIQLSDAEALGLDAAYDANNNVQVYYHIAEFFRINPDGVLCIMLVAKGTTQTEMWDKDEDFVSKLFNTHKDIKFIATVLNPADSYTPDTTNGIDDDAEDAAPLAQALVDDLFSKSLYLDVCLIEGRNVTGDVASLLDTTTLDAPNVKYIIGCDPDQVALNDKYAGSAAMGAALASIGVRRVHESMGSVELEEMPFNARGQASFSLTSQVLGRFLDAALTDGRRFAEITPTEDAALTAKGYGYVGFFEGYQGLYWANSNTAVEPASDFSKIENNRVWNKAARRVRNVLIPKIRSTVPVTPEGQLSQTVIGRWTATVEAELEAMQRAGEISDFLFYMAPEQDVLAGDPIETRLTVTPIGIAEGITNYIGFTNPFQQV